MVQNIERIKWGTKYGTSLGFDSEMLTNNMDNDFLNAEGAHHTTYPLSKYNMAIKNQTSVPDLEILLAENEAFVKEYLRQVSYHLSQRIPSSSGIVGATTPDTVNANIAQSWANTASRVREELKARIAYLKLNPHLSSSTSINRKGALTSVDDATVVTNGSSPSSEGTSPINGGTPMKKWLIWGAIGLTAITVGYFIIKKFRSNA